MMEKIKDLLAEDRPREKIIAKGVGALSSSELLAVILGSGTYDRSALQISSDIIKSANQDLGRIARYGLKELTNFNGVGNAKGALILAAIEFGKRLRNETNEKCVITGSNAAFQLMRGELSDLPHEEFWVVYLNRANVVVDKEKISQGGVSATVVDSKIIIKKALLLLASSIILVHNHPSGNLKPSQEDKNMTKKVKSACELLEINLLDHIIVAGNSYYSFADKLAL